MINNYIKALPLTEQKVSAWKNKVASSINSCNVIAGSGIRIDYGPNGSEISFDGIDEQSAVVYAGNFNFNKEYYPNQIVRVIDTTYLNQNGAVIPVGTNTYSSGSIIPIALGSFICVNYVPPAGCDETWLNTTIAPMYPQGVPFNLIQGTRFYAANTYYPVYPEPTAATSSYSVLIGQSTIIANNTFWHLLSGGAGSGFPVWL